MLFPGTDQFDKELSAERAADLALNAVGYEWRMAAEMIKALRTDARKALI
jgi:hypothetical protein